MLPDRKTLEAARETVMRHIDPTPQYRWPLLCEALGTEVWVKHENHLPTGAFKLRGGLGYCDALTKSGNSVRGLVTATRGNHGQSIAFAAHAYGLRACIVVPEGNSREKNAAIRALGATLVEHGEDFQAAREHAELLAVREELHRIPSIHPALVAGVASYALEFFAAAGDIDRVYVPIGMGSGACAFAAARNALGLKTRIVGVVSAHARAYADAFASGAECERPVATRLADGLACRRTDPYALAILRAELDTVVCVNDQEVAAAMALMFRATHNVAEGAGAASLAAAMQQRSRLGGLRVGVVLSGGNVDSGLFAEVLGHADSLPFAA